MDEISRTKLTRLLEGRMAYGDAQAVDGLIGSALASLDALMKYGVHLVLAPLDTDLDKDMAEILSDAHPANQPIQEYPKWAYHDKEAPILLDSEDDVADLPPGYHDATGNELSPIAPVKPAEPEPYVPPAKSEIGLEDHTPDTAIQSGVVHEGHDVVPSIVPAPTYPMTPSTPPTVIKDPEPITPETLAPDHSV